jgi:meiosis induction protein kinase IME2/SME1
MQCGAGARRDWVGKRLVAVKRMKRVWKGGWEEASRLGELVVSVGEKENKKNGRAVSNTLCLLKLRTHSIQSLRDIPPHPAIIPLYDAFIQPDSRELYFVFECMEGNLYQLTKSRKGRPLAAGLVASIYHQIVGGLHHIHHSGYFHRDMKPENLLVTTTGLQDYMPVIDPETAATDRLLSSHGMPVPQRPNPRIEKDVTVIVKLADFGLARSLTSLPPYTEYVSTRWYRAPEVLLRSKEYSAPVDMWALGTILAELVNLKALFPGQGEVDQVYRITEVLGDPSREYGKDERGRQRGGGDWDRGIKMAKAVGFSFPKVSNGHHHRGRFNGKADWFLLTSAENPCGLH